MQKMTCGAADRDVLTNVAELRAEIRRAFGIITGKWKLEILWLLKQRMHRFSELRRSIPGITQHMLTAQLRELEADGLVRRTIFPEVPPRVEYRITPAAEGLELVFEAIRNWSELRHSAEEAHKTLSEAE
jgi:DNA-binding HxlR family transcriptional regulator